MEAFRKGSCHGQLSIISMLCTFWLEGDPVQKFEHNFGKYD